MLGGYKLKMLHLEVTFKDNHKIESSQWAEPWISAQGICFGQEKWPEVKIITDLWAMAKTVRINIGRLGKRKSGKGLCVDP